MLLRPLLLLLALSLLAGAPSLVRAEGEVSASTRPSARPAGGAWLLHLPGIAGEAGIDRSMIGGLKDAGFDGEIETYDWVGEHQGIDALRGRARNEATAQKIADRIAAHRRAHPEDRILLTSHSGGGGLAVWALERLPADVKVDSVLLLAPALSPRYDLSKALRHVSGRAYAFTSEYDSFVLGTGTRVFGTIDGEKCEAAGKCGFSQPDGADPDAYRKLTARPFDRAWMRYGHNGDHIGVMSRRFAEAVLAPLLLGAGEAPASTTRPAKG